MKHSQKLLKLANYFLLLLAIMYASIVVAHEPPETNKNRLWPKVNYLDSPDYGIYELSYYKKQNKVFAAVMDRMHKAENIGFIEVFDAKTLAKVASYPMPYRVFSLAQNPAKDWLYAGHTQISQISKVDAATGKILATSNKITLNPLSVHDHLRHMVYSEKTGELFVTHVAMIKDGDKISSECNLVILDGNTLKVKGVVKDAYPSVGYGVTINQDGSKIYTLGGFVQEIDVKSKKVVKSIDISLAKPKIELLSEATVDSVGSRIFANTQAVPGNEDGVYVFDLKTGKQLSYIKTAPGPMGVAYNPKYHELYVASFFGGKLNVIDSQTYKIKHKIKTPIFPNMVTQSSDYGTLYLGIKEGFNRNWNPDQYIEGAKERIMSISLDPEPAKVKTGSSKQ